MVRNMSLSASLMNRRYALCILLLLYLILIGEGPKREIEAAFEEVAIEMGNSWMKSACGFVVGLWYYRHDIKAWWQPYGAESSVIEMVFGEDCLKISYDHTLPSWRFDGREAVPYSDIFEARHRHFDVTMPGENWFDIKSPGYMDLKTKTKFNVPGYMNLKKKIFLCVAQGVGVARCKKKFFFGNFFSTCEKINQFLEFCKDQGGKI